MTLDLLDQNQDQRSNFDYLGELAGPGKKFDITKYETEDAWKQAVAKSRIMADDHIRQLEEDNRKLREDFLREREYNTSRASLEQVADRLMNQQPTSSDNTLNAKEPEQPKFDTKQYEELVDRRFQQLTAAQRQEANVKMVSDKLTEEYGPNYRTVLKQNIDELGLDASYVNDMVRNQPQVLFRILGVGGANQKQQETFQPPVKSQTTFAPQGKQKRTWAYYQNMKKTNPEEYNKPSTLQQMEADALELGDEFEDGNWKQYKLREV